MADVCTGYRTHPKYNAMVPNTKINTVSTTTAFKKSMNLN